MTDTATQPSASTNGGTGPRPKPIFEAKKVAEVPADLSKRGGPRSDPAFIEALNAPMQDAGEWYEVATFKSETGAKTKLKAIKDGKVSMPKGEWDIEARRVENPDDPDARWSKLYAKYMG